MNFINTEIFGKVPEPSSLVEILDIVDKHRSAYINVFFWRGQGDINWPVHSAAYRRLKKDHSVITEKLISRYEVSLIDSARYQGYGYVDGRKLSDFEVLARLQHHGAATRLIDFSRNILVSLWFACNSEPDKTGCLFGIHSAYVGGYEGISLDERYEEVFEDEDILQIRHPQSWQPPVVTKRIAAQGAHFLYSTIVDNKMGSLAFVEKKEAYIVIALSPEIKKKLLLTLQQVFDIRQFTLFPDLDGFGAVNSERFSIRHNDRW
ncbi:hypothetical protein SMKC041_10080 [Serratia marcescens]|nr:hypothetical protein SMKC041_10080 [Serratia marcescens]